MSKCPLCGASYTCPPLPNPATMTFEDVMRYTRQLAQDHTDACRARMHADAVKGLPSDVAQIGRMILEGAL